MLYLTFLNILNVSLDVTYAYGNMFIKITMTLIQPKWVLYWLDKYISKCPVLLIKSLCNDSCNRTTAIQKQMFSWCMQLMTKHNNGRFCRLCNIQNTPWMHVTARQQEYYTCKTLKSFTNSILRELQDHSIYDIPHILQLIMVLAHF